MPKMSPAKALSRSLFQREGGGKGVLVYYSDIFKQILYGWEIILSYGLIF